MATIPPDTISYLESVPNGLSYIARMLGGLTLSLLILGIESKFPDQGGDIQVWKVWLSECCNLT